MREGDIYRTAALAELWRLTSLIDRNQFSATRGSLSRTHWAWKFEDFPFPRMQEGVYALTRLYALPGEDNPLFQCADVHSWIEWAFEYWISRQRDNGAFDEAYPYEQCLAATAFTTFYVGQAFVLHRQHLAPDLEGRIAGALRRAGDWLLTNDETHGLLSNHLAVAVAALELVTMLSGDQVYSVRARYFLERILTHQSDEGWMREYDGADIGYGTHGFFYLASYWQLTGCTETLSALQRCARFLAYFVHPDGTIGGEYSSRNTEFFYPAGFEMLAADCATSAGIASYMRRAIAERRVCGVWAMDSFNFMPMMNNLLFAMDAATDGSAVEPVGCARAPFSKYFRDSGLWVINGERQYTIIGLSKGGTVSLFDKKERRLGARHAGLVATDGRRRFTSQDYLREPSVTWSNGGKTARIGVPWKELGQLVFTPKLFIAFRLFNLSFGRLPAISRLLKKALVHVLIARRNRPPIEHQRTIRCEGDAVMIEDDIALPASIKRLHAVAQFASIHMGSALYTDVRVFQGSTATAEWESRERMRLCGTLDMTGAQWRMQED